jgi:hypothetical protein
VDGVHEGNVYVGQYNLELRRSDTAPNPDLPLEGVDFDGTSAEELVASIVPKSNGRYLMGTFCIDINQDAPKSYRQYDIVPLEQAPIPIGQLMTTQQANDLRMLMSYLPSALTADKAAAFQAAVWEIINEADRNYNVHSYGGSGSTGFRVGSTAGWTDTANSYLGDILDTYNNDLTLYEQIVAGSEVAALVNEDAQDYALKIPGFGGAENVIPEPLTCIGLGMGLVGCVGYIRRRRAATA